MVRFWALQHLGGFLSLGAEVAADAPRLKVAGRDVAIYDQPALFACVGLVGGAR
jgi:hypothetical protein